MHIVEKLEDKIDSLLNEINYLKSKNSRLQEEIKQLNDVNDQLKYNNETMYLNIDKALHIVNDSKNSTANTTEQNDDILNKALNIVSDSKEDKNDILHKS